MPFITEDDCEIPLRQFFLFFFFAKNVTGKTLTASLFTKETTIKNQTNVLKYLRDFLLNSPGSSLALGS